MITERKRAPRRTHMPCEKCGKDVLLENLDILMMGGMPEKVWHNECLKILKHNALCLETCSCKRKKKLVNNLHNGNHKPQTNGEEYDPSYLVEEYTGLKLPYVGAEPTETAPPLGEISVLAEAEILLEKESTASDEGGGTSTHIDQNERRIRSCRDCGKEIFIARKQRGRPPLKCGNCRSGVTG